MKKNIKTSKKSTVLNFVHFLQNEFGIGNLDAFKKVERKTIKAIKQEKVHAKENFHKIGKLIDDALKHLPDVDEITSDHDDKHSLQWKDLHAEIKSQLHKEKVERPHTDILFVSSGKKSANNISYSYDWKTLTLSLFLFSIILMNCFFCLNPQSVYKVLAYADNLIGQEKQIEKNFNKENIAFVDLNQIGVDEAEIADAKVRYIKENQEKLQNKKAVGVSAKDLFGQIAGASEYVDLEKIKDNKNGKLETILETIKISWINLFKEIF